MVRMESFHQTDVLEVIFAQDSYEVLAVYRNGELEEDES